MTSKSLLLLVGLLWLASASCKKEEPPAAFPATAAAPGPILPTSPTPDVVASPAPAPVIGAAAVGLPCASEQDLQCAYAHCTAGRCGGCRSSAECKPGVQCLPTLLGYACLPALFQPAAAAAPTPAAVPLPAATGGDPLDALRARCVQRTNDFRARVSLAPLARQSGGDACLDGQAQNDAQSNTAHGAFGRCQEGGQNECPGWPGPLEQVIDQCLAQMFAEGPGPFAGHGHYLNMTDPKFNRVACGFSTAANGQIWLIQNFYR